MCIKGLLRIMEEEFLCSLFYGASGLTKAYSPVNKYPNGVVNDK